MVVFDTNFLIHLMQKDSPPVKHPDTKEFVTNVSGRIKYLIGKLHENNTKILIPTPVLAEVLTRFGNRAEELIRTLNNTYRFEFAPFDTTAAIEIGMTFYSSRQSGDKRGGSRRSWQRVKFDRQIVSIAKTRNATTVYSNDDQVRKYAEESGMKGVAIWELDEPPP